MKEKIILGKWSESDLDELLDRSYAVTNVGRKIDLISRYFLGVPYKGSTLTGGVKITEVLVIDLEKVDCFTFLDYTEAMRISGSFAEFKTNLKKVRYRSGKVQFKNRNHFFADWGKFNAHLVQDVTELVSAGKSKVEKKVLNQKDDGTFLLPGIPCTKRRIVHIPSENIDDSVIQNLRTGDYIGIYSRKDGLDVSHVGIFIRKGNSVLLRHASSTKKYRKVVDESFKKYIKDKPGIIVLRPREIS